jgi:hypothetical protein
VPTVGSLIELRRYPVKSLAGEILTIAAVDRGGLDGDRRWAVTDADGRFGSSKSTRRFRKMDGLLQLTASYDRHLNPIIGFPDGRRIPGDDVSVPRCVMVDLAQHELPPAPGLLDTIGRHDRACVGVVADVLHAGTTRLSDPVQLLDRPEPPARMG